MTARITWHRAPRAARSCSPSSHGAGGGIEARDLQALAAALPAHGVTVALVEQPWRVAGKKVAPAPKTLDAGWRGLWPALAQPGLPVVAGGRSAGARVACRTAAELGAAGRPRAQLPAAPAGQAGEVPRRELLGAGRAHARRPGRQRPVRAAGGVPARARTSWSRCRTATTASPCQAGADLSQEEALAVDHRRRSWSGLASLG